MVPADAAKAASPCNKKTLVRRSPMAPPPLLLLAALLALAALSSFAEAAPQPEALSHPGAMDDLPEDVSEMLRRDPSYVLGMLDKLRRYRKPMENTKRGIDFGLGRGYSGNQAAKHMMGLVASQYAGGPGKKRKRGGQVVPANYEIIQDPYY